MSSTVTVPLASRFFMSRSNISGAISGLVSLVSFTVAFFPSKEAVRIPPDPGLKEREALGQMIAGVEAAREAEGAG